MAQVGLCACVCVKCTVQWTDCNVLCIMQWTACLGPWGMGFIILCHGLMVEDVYVLCATVMVACVMT